jgi:hypothetical protein
MERDSPASSSLVSGNLPRHRRLGQLQDKADYWRHQAPWPNGPGIAKEIGPNLNRPEQAKEKAPAWVPFRSLSDEPIVLIWFGSAVAVAHFNAPFHR